MGEDDASLSGIGDGVEPASMRMDYERMGVNGVVWRSTTYLCFLQALFQAPQLFRSLLHPHLDL